MKFQDVYIAQVSDSEDLKSDVKFLIQDANLRRRMNRLSKVGVSTAMECLQQDVERMNQIDAIITATGFGFLSDSEKFLMKMTQNQEEFINPSLFIYSTFNTVGSQIALLLNNHCYNMTHTHRGHSFESALLDGILQMKSNGAKGAKNVLVGAFEETTATEVHILKRLRMNVPEMPSERATFFVLTNNPGTSKALAKIKSLEFNTEWKEVKERLQTYYSNGIDCAIYCNGMPYIYSEEKDFYPNEKDYFCPIYAAHTLWKVIKTPSVTGSCFIYMQYPRMTGTLLEIEKLNYKKGVRENAF